MSTKLEAEIAEVLNDLSEMSATELGEGRPATSRILDQAANHLRRARFHERENFDRWQVAEAALGRVRAALSDSDGGMA